MKQFFKKITWLQVAIFVGAWIPLIQLIVLYFNGGLGVNPIQELEQRSGRTAITFLVLSLACTPVNILTGWREVIKRNRALGLYSFMYAAIHVTTFLYLDYGFDWKQIFSLVLEKRFIFLGALGFLILLALAVTSFDSSKRWLRKNWKKLHKLVYYAGLILVFHYAWAKKGDLFSLQGDIVRPLVYGLIVILLLVIRMKTVRKFIQNQRVKLVNAFKNKTSLNKSMHNG